MADKKATKAKEEVAAKDVAVDESAEKRTATAKDIVRKRTYAAVGAGLIPIPVFDMVALAGIQLEMVNKLTKHYGHKFKKSAGKAFISALVGTYLPVSAAPIVSSLVKTIPIIGQVTGAVTLSVFGGASTYAVGQVFIQHYESGGTFLDFDPEAVKDYFAEQFEEGKKIAADVK
jgi:uncharacterized protein (DUF697 family)